MKITHKHLIMETLELNETNYYDQNSVAIEFTVEEHELLKDIIIHATDGMNIAVPYVYDLPKDSEVRQRYEMIESMSERVCKLWKNRFENVNWR